MGRNPDFLTPLPNRACDLCIHGTGPAGDRKCEHPEGRITVHEAAPVAVVRAINGNCGPEARFLHMAAWGRT